MQVVHIAYTSLTRFLDCICRCIDNILCQAKEMKEDISEGEPEEMIMMEAELEYLKKENSKLKRLYYPKELIYEAELDIYRCPNCKKIVSQAMLEEKLTLYCNLCGQRIYGRRK